VTCIQEASWTSRKWYVEDYEMMLVNDTVPLLGSKDDRNHVLAKIVSPPLPLLAYPLGLPL
jgi:hypothetical protein